MRHVLPFVASFLAVSARAQDVSQPTPDTKCDGLGMVEVTYWPRAAVDFDPRRCAAPGDCAHRGWLYYELPPPGQPFLPERPAIVYLHGHERERNEPCAMAEFFVKKGFVFFAPLRSGHVAKRSTSRLPDGSAGPKLESKGVHIDLYAAACDTDCQVGTPNLCLPFCQPNHLEYNKINYLSSQTADVGAALDFLQSPASPVPVKDGAVALLGHSFGGSLAVMSNAALPFAVRAVVDVSGAELSWDALWRDSLEGAVHLATVPTYFLQPSDGQSLEPTRVLSNAAFRDGQESQAGIFPPAPGATSSLIHSNFVALDDMVANWGPSVVQFLHLHFVK